MLVIAIPVIGFSSVYNIQEQEQAVLTTLGTAKAVRSPVCILKSRLFSGCRR